jgi:hypothetical protein
VRRAQRSISGLFIRRNLVMLCRPTCTMDGFKKKNLAGWVAARRRGNAPLVLVRADRWLALRPGVSGCASPIRHQMSMLFSLFFGGGRNQTLRAGYRQSVGRAATASSSMLFCGQILSNPDIQHWVYHSASKQREHKGT